MRMKILLLSFLFLFSFSLALSSIPVPAVDASGNGVVTAIEARTAKGTGDVFVSITPLVSLDTQNSEKTAVKIASERAKANPNNYDVFFRISSSAEVVDGPSAGAALTLLSYSEFTGKKIRGDLVVTGTIERDGRIGKVGGIFEKANAIASVNSSKVRIFLIPRGQALQSGVDLRGYANEKWNLQVAEIDNIDELIGYAFTPTGSKLDIIEKVTPPLNLIPFSASRKTKPFEDLARTELDETVAGLSDAEKNRTNNQSGFVFAQLKEALNTSKQQLSKGYYYSSANTAFLSGVALDDLKLSNASSEQLFSGIGGLKKTLNGIDFAQTTSDNLEWVTGAKLRYYWAKRKINETESKSSLPPIYLIDSYSVANSWATASKRLNAIAGNVSTGRQIDESHLREIAFEYLNSASRLEKEGKLDSEGLNHFDSARDSFDDGEYAASAFDSSLAIAYSDALDEADDKTYGELLTEICGSPSFNSSCSVLSKKKPASVWGELYFAHAVYNLQESNRTSDMETLVNAVRLIKLSEKLDSLVSRILETSATGEASSSSVPSVSSSCPTSSDSQYAVSVSMQPSGSDTFSKLLFGASAVAILLLLIFVALLVFRGKKGAKKEVYHQIDYTRRLDSAERMLLEGKLSEKTYETLRKKYEKLLKKSRNA